MSRMPIVYVTKFPATELAGPVINDCVYGIDRERERRIERERDMKDER
jgi:hypothetical protein